MLDTTSRPRVFSVGTVEDCLFDYDLGFREQQLIPNSQVIISSSQTPCDIPKQTPHNPALEKGGVGDPTLEGGERPKAQGAHRLIGLLEEHV